MTEHYKYRGEWASLIVGSEESSEESTVDFRLIWPHKHWTDPDTIVKLGAKDVRKLKDQLDRWLRENT